MANQKDDKIREILRELAAEFFSRESNGQSLITITDVELTNRGGKAIVKMTVLPESKEVAALDFARRQIMDFKTFVQEKSRIARIPFFEIALDAGEKNRQKLDEISKNL